MAFEVKGRALVATMRMLERAPGGPETVLKTLPADDQKYFAELFLEAGWYAMDPYVRIMSAIASMRKMSVREWMRVQADRTAAPDVEGIYRMSLKSATPREMARRLPRAFNRYFQPCNAVLIELADEHADFELRIIPAKHAEFFRGINEGFVVGALRYAGAEKPSVRYADPVSGEPHEGEATLTLPFRASFGN